MLNVAGMGAVAPVIVSVGRESFPAVQAGGFINGIRVLANRLRIFRPPLPAARIRAEFSLSPAGGLNKRRTTVFAAGGNLGFRTRPHTRKVMGCAEISNGIPAETKLCRNDSISHVTFPEQSNLFSLFIG